jgi:hypothetical protein
MSRVASQANPNPNAPLPIPPWVSDGNERLPNEAKSRDKKRDRPSHQKALTLGKPSRIPSRVLVVRETIRVTVRVTIVVCRVHESPHRARQPIPRSHGRVDQ